MNLVLVVSIVSPKFVEFSFEKLNYYKFKFLLKIIQTTKCVFIVDREWIEVAPMGLARMQPGVATLCGRVYAVGGEQSSQILANGEVYDPQVRTEHF